MPTVTNNITVSTSVKTNNIVSATEVKTNNISLDVSSAFAAGEAFIFTVDTTQTGTSNSDQFTLPLPNVGSYDAWVLWGDSTIDNITAYDQAEITHTYPSEGSYTVQVVGTLGGFQFNNGGDRLKLTNVSQCGVLDISTNSAFEGCENMTWTATDAPTISTTTLAATFNDCFVFNGAIGNWDISSVTSLASIFVDCSSFNQDISSWNTSNITNMRFSFTRASSFDQDLSTWNISSLSDGTGMFTSVTLSTANYDAILTSWGNQAVQSGVSVSFGNSQYTINSAADTARDSLQITNGWTITDGGAVGAIAEFNTLISTGYTSGYQPVLGADKAALSTFMSALDSDGILDKLDVLYLFATSGDADFALLNLVDATAFEATAVNSPTFTINEGWTGDGLTSYLDTNWAASTNGVNYTLNSASIGVYVNDVGTNQSDLIAAFGATSQFSSIRTVGDPTRKINVRVNNNNGGNNLEADSNFTSGLHVAERSDSNTITVYKDGSSNGTKTDSTVSLLPTISHYILGRNARGSLASVSDAQISSAFMGASLTATEHVQLNNAINAYLFGLEVASPQAETTTYLQRLDSQNYSRPSVDNCVALDTLISGLKTDGIFSKLDVLYMFATDSQAASLVNLITPASFEATAVNSPTFTANQGWTGDGVSAYIDWNWSPLNDAVNLTQNSACIFTYEKNLPPVENGYLLGSADSGRIIGHRSFTGGNNTFFVNSTSTAPNLTTGILTGGNFIAGDRPDSTTEKAYVNGVEVNEVTENSDTLSGQNMYSLAINASGTPATESDGTVLIQGVGASLTATEHANLNTRITTYLTAVGAI